MNATSTPPLSVQWAVTGELCWLTRAIAEIPQDCIFDDLKDALEEAKRLTHGANTIGYYIWLLNERRSLVAIARGGKLFYSYNTDEPHPDSRNIVPPTNPLRAAFPWAIDPTQDFCVEPGLSKREWMAGTFMGALMESDELCTGEMAEIAVSAADALLKALSGEAPKVAPKSKPKTQGYLSPTEGWVTGNNWPD